MWQCDNVTLRQCDNVTLRQCDNVTMTIWQRFSNNTYYTQIYTNNKRDQRSILFLAFATVWQILPKILHICRNRSHHCIKPWRELCARKWVLEFIYQTWNYESWFDLHRHFVKRSRWLWRSLGRYNHQVHPQNVVLRGTLWPGTVRLP